MSIVLFATNKEIPIKYSTFPAGECYVKLEDAEEVAQHSQFTIIVTAADAETIMRILLIADAIRAIVVAPYIVARFDYLPYGRQDRVCSKGESFSLKVFSDILATRIDKVVSYDIHSEVGSNLFTDYGLPYTRKFINVDTGVSAFLKDMLPTGRKTLVLSPDAGAKKRMEKFKHALQLSDGHTAYKERTSEGITTYLQKSAKLTAAEVIIIPDDICDGGGTFLALEKEIRKHNSTAILVLVISHGIFSKGTKPLTDKFTVLVTDDDYNNRRLQAL